MKSLPEWLNHITELHPASMKLGLERLLPLISVLNLNHFPCPVITVGGTNGKGSCVCFLESIYAAAGYRVLAYTSPHILHFNERLRIEGQAVDEAKLIEAFEVIERARGHNTLTFFEFTTLACLWICQKSKADVILLEVGLGGRLDAVNAVDADVAVIASVDIDHTDYLGETRELIGAEKAGIFRRGAPAISGEPHTPLSVVEYAEQIGAPLFCIHRDFFYQAYEHHWSWTGPKTHYSGLPLPRLKLQNAATTLMVIESLAKVLPVSESAIRHGLERAALAGRFERFDWPTGVTLFLDVAHNPHAAKYLAENIAMTAPEFGKTRAVFGILKDKDIQGCIDAVYTLIDAWYVSELSVERAARAQDIAEQIQTRAQKNCYTFASVSEALAEALACSSPRDRIVIFGSFYTVAGAKQYLAGLQATTEAVILKQGFRVTNKMKQRVVGGLVLLGLIAVFLPLLFNDPQPANNPALELVQEIPKVPPLPQVQLQLSEPAPDTVVAQAVAENTPVLKSSSSTTPIVASPSSPPKATPGMTPATPPMGLPVVAGVATVTTPAPSAAVPAAVLQPKLFSVNTPDAWTVQLGSFVSSAGAQDLIRRLRARGFDAYLRSGLVNGKTVFRVFVGPEIDQQKVQAVQKKLEREFKLSGVVKKYTVD